MAQTTIRLPLTGIGAVSYYSPNDVIDLSDSNYYEVTYSTKFLFPVFQSFPSNLSHNRLYMAKAVFKIQTGSPTYQDVCMLKAIDRPVDLSTLKWNDKPNGLAQLIQTPTAITNPGDYVFQPPAGEDAEQSAYAAKKILKYGAGAINQGGLGRGAYIYLKKLNDGVTTPYLEITYDNTEKVKSKIAVQSGPTGGYSDPRNATQFSWVFVKDDTYHCVDDTFEQSAATLYWKESTAENYTAVSATGSTKSVTIPANTFPTNAVIQWYVSGTDDCGTPSQTPVYSFSTSAPLIISTPISPINTIEDGQSEITLQWSFSSTDGRNPIRFFLYWREAGASVWQTLYDPGAGVIATSYNVPAGTFSAGSVEWGVQALNVDEVAGAVGSATFINFAAPTVNNVSADAVPFSTVTWQASDQQAYRIMVDDVLYGPYFGTEKTFELPDYLVDGNHTIKVSVVGTYALWSDWAQTTVSIQNIPGEAISIDAEAMIDVSMLIYTQESNPLFLIYRDGVLIGKTNQSRFTDRFALGEHSYKVISKLANGNYSASNEILRTVYVENANIALLEGGEWLEIKYTAKDQRDPAYEDSVTVSYNHLAGDEYPSAVISQYCNKKVNYTALFLFTQEVERKAFESMYRKPVIFKFRDGTVFVGVLDSWSKRPVRNNYTEYTFSVTQIDFEDFADDTQ